jgi:hypothetical protein
MTTACAGTMFPRSSVPPMLELRYSESPKSPTQPFRSPFPPRKNEGCYITGKPIAETDKCILIPVSDETFHMVLLEAFFDAAELTDPDKQAAFLTNFTGEHGTYHMRSLLWRKLEQRDQKTIDRLLANIGLT